jgi:hypothetical protein
MSEMHPSLDFQARACCALSPSDHPQHGVELDSVWRSAALVMQIVKETDADQFNHGVARGPSGD